MGPHEKDGSHESTIEKKEIKRIKQKKFVNTTNSPMIMQT